MNRAKTLVATAVIAAWPLAAVAQAGAGSGSGATGAGSGGTTRYDAPPPGQRTSDSAPNPGTSSGLSGTTQPSDGARATTGNQGSTMGGTTTAAGAASSIDRSFVANAGSGGLLEVEASRLALERAQSSEIREFARRMVDEHSKANAELMEIARSAQITDVPVTMNPRHRGILERLRVLNGQDFDRQYAEQIGLASHHETVSLFERASREASNPELRAFATKTLPNLRTHLQQSQQVASAVGVSSDRIQAAGASSGMAAGTAGTAAAASTGRPMSTTTGLDRTTGLSDADWERGRASRYSLLPWTSYGYVGLNLGRSNWGDSCDGISGIFDCDDSAFSGKFYTGGLISRMVGLELGYVNFGRPDTASGNWKAHGINASIVANLPVDPVNLFARFGTTYGWTTTPAGAGPRSGDDDGFGISYGAGLGFDVTPQFQVTVEWDRTRFNFVNEDQDLDMYSLGVRYKF